MGAAWKPHQEGSEEARGWGRLTLLGQLPPTPLPHIPPLVGEGGLSGRLGNWSLGPAPLRGSDPKAHSSNHLPGACYHLLSTYCVPDTLWGSIPDGGGERERRKSWEPNGLGVSFPPAASPQLSQAKGRGSCISACSPPPSPGTSVSFLGGGGVRREESEGGPGAPIRAFNSPARPSVIECSFPVTAQHKGGLSWATPPGGQAIRQLSQLWAS